MTDYENMIERLYEYYYENGKTKSIEYSFGFFDAVAVLRIFQEKDKIK